MFFKDFRWMKNQQPKPIELANYLPLRMPLKLSNEAQRLRPATNYGRNT
jgi:hypothetical protein